MTTVYKEFMVTICQEFQVKGSIKKSDLEDPEKMEEILNRPSSSFEGEETMQVHGDAVYAIE